MKADFEKGTKVCSCCKKELPLDMFSKNTTTSDGLRCHCKKCSYEYNKMYYSSDRGKKSRRTYNNKRNNTFGRIGHKRGHSGTLKRDYELSEEQLNRRNAKRRYLKNTGRQKRQGILIWYSGELEGLSKVEYIRAMNKEYNRQKRCAIRGYVGRTQPSEHFLFDFDLEQMLKDKVYYMTGKANKCMITKWWKGEIRHWTVKDGIWKE